MDATIIDAPSSTKNEEKERGPEMYSTKMGNPWQFGMNCHVGVDAGTGYVHTIKVTPANVHDVTVASELIREDDKVVYGDSAYLGLQKRPEAAHDERLSSIECRVNLRPSTIPAVSGNAIDWTRWIEKRKSSVRCKVEHIFRIIKYQFGYRKARYRGLKKNDNRLYAMFTCATFISWRWPDEGCKRHDKGFFYSF